MAFINEQKKNQNKKEQNQKKAVNGPLQQPCLQVPRGSALDSVWWQASMGKQQGQVGGDGCWRIDRQR